MAEEPYPQNGLSGKDWILPPPTGTPILEEYEKGGVKGGGLQRWFLDHLS